MAALHVTESGRDDGPLLVLLHGAGNSHGTFGFVGEGLEALGTRARLLAVDLRGHGVSPRTPAEYGLDAYTADVEALLDEVGPAHVVGNSLGGAIAWTLAQRRPELVRAALLEDPPLRRVDLDAAAAVFGALRDQVRRWQATGATLETVAAVLGAMPGPGGRRPSDVQAADAIEARAQGLLDVDPEALGAVADGTTLATIDLAAPPRVPVRVLAADEARGSVLPEAAAAALVAAHPDVTVRRWPDAGHVVHDEIAHRRDWLAEVDALLAR
ncbi:alpha/beta fold hydrolase [Actinomycetospora sp. OC33-EN08]|uniref:Alpha/beta fold hydrolase n=1 Tax=Actinomycetospora aurantiaca TaxID=3129233 RepID=A0ABU8MQB9_9PSEU